MTNTMDDWELILRYLKNEASQQERGILEKWLQENKANKALFEQVKNTWDSSGALEQNLTIDKPKAWQSIRQKIASEDKITASPGAKNKSYLSWYAGMAACIAMAVFAIYLFRSSSLETETLTVKAVEENRTVVLPDCTQVVLNKNSTLMYPKEFDANSRKISFTGEAFFNVTKNAEKPFIIENENFEVTVLGTSFNISAYEKSQNSIITVVTGKVALKSKAGESIILVKDERGIIDLANKLMTKQKNSDLNFLSWKTKKLEFKDAGFQEVCNKLEDYFAIKIEVKNQEILKCKFTGLFEDPALEQIISILEKTLNIKMQVNNKQVIITGKGC
jgi:transmembrane sensor